VRRVQIGQTLKEQQPEEYRKLKKRKKKRRARDKSKLSFRDIEKLMQGNCHTYRRGKGGALKQVR
jgi:hypothetical protein